MAEKLKVQVGNYTRIVEYQTITFTCEYCKQEVIEDRYPGPKSKYCTRCKPDIIRIRAMLRQRKRRASQLGESFDIYVEFQKIAQQSISTKITTAKSVLSDNNQTRNVIVGVRLSESNSIHHLAYQSNMQSTLCGLTTTTKYQEVKVFDKRDCSKCRSIVEQEGIVCPACLNPLLGISKDGLCDQCSSQGQWFKSRI